MSVPPPPAPRGSPAPAAFNDEGITVTTMKRALIAGIAGGAMILSLAACSSGSGDSGSGSGDGGLVGVAMPTKSSERWIADGNNVKSQLEEAGYQVDLQYAEDDIPTQVSQLENMITKGAKALIVASIDGTTLTSVLEEAAANDIPVIAYDRLIRDSENVDYYATFDNYKVGVQQATSLLAGLGLTDLTGAKAADAPAGPFNVELFAGSPDDNNATFFFNGAMDTLQPYIDDKTLVVKSGETDFNTVATLRWDGEVAQSRMEDILTKTYSDGSKVQGVLSPYDGLSRGRLHRRLRLPDHHRSGRRARLRQGDHRRRAVRDHLQGHPRARQGGREDGPGRARGHRARGQRHRHLRQR